MRMPTSRKRDDTASLHISPDKPKLSTGLLSSSTWFGQPASLFSSSANGGALALERTSFHASFAGVATGIGGVMSSPLPSLVGREAADATSRQPSTLTRRGNELAWIRQHFHELSQLEGQWIVVEGHSLIASGPTVADVMQQATRSGISNPFLYRVQKTRPDVAYMGL